MRVIAGSARHLTLVTPSGMETRPTLDRTKETLFNMLNSYLPGSSFLDLYSGSGGIGIEALSRGAISCVFVENATQALNCIRENLVHTKLLERAKVLPTDVFSAIERLSDAHEQFDFIFLDPPFLKGLEEQTLRALVKSNLLKEDTWIVVESSNKTSFDFIDDLSLEIVKKKDYKTNMHIILRKI